MLAQIVPPAGTVCSFKEESSNMDPKFDLDQLSYSLRACEPFSASVINPSTSSIAEDISSSEIFCGALDSISLLEISRQRDDERNDNVRLDDTVGINCHDNVCSSPPRRSARVTKLNQKNLSSRAAKGRGKKILKKEMLDSILKVERKTRSSDCRRARSSIWGSNGISKYFGKSGSEVILKGIKKLEKSRGIQGTGKEKNYQAVSGLHFSEGNTSASFGRIRIKVKHGKESGQMCTTDMISGTENGPQVEASSIENRKVTNFIGHTSSEDGLEVRGTQCCDRDVEKVVMSSESLDTCLNKHMESSVTGKKLDAFAAGNHQEIPSPVDVQESGVSVDNKYSDLGTSPDSEVINLTPEAQINEKERDEFHDVQNPSQTCVSFSDFASLNLPSESLKKENIIDNTPSACTFNMQDRLDRLGILDNASVVDTSGKERKFGDDLDLSEASILTTTANLSSNTSSSDGPRELLPSSIVGYMGNVLPCTKSKGKKHLKNSRSKNGIKSRPENFESPMSKKGNSCRQKRNAAKSNEKIKVKDKAASGEFARTVKDYLEEGYNPLDIFGKAETELLETCDIDLVHKDAPAHCIPPRNAWVLCDECFKWRRIPAILADSIDETNSKWTCKENVDKDYADCSIPQEKSNSEINAELEISDAEDSPHDGFNPKGSQPDLLGGHKQSSWRLIKSNKFMHRSRKSQTIDEIMVCHCKPSTNGKLGCSDGCLNRMLNIECVRGTCPCGEHCSNQQFQKRKYAKLKWFRCGKKGYGLQLLEDISEGQFLIEYIGEVLDMQAYEARQKDYASQGHKHFYFMTLNGSEVIDACGQGNLGRFINHSCEPNCRTEKWMVNGEVCIGLFALKDLKKGEEVTFDYNYVRVFGAAAKKCVCGSSLCRGYIGGDPRNSEVIVQGDSDDEFPEPVMVYDDGEVDDSLKKLISTTTVLNDTKALTHIDKLERAKPAVEYLKGTKELRLEDVMVNDDDKTDDSANDVLHLESPCRKSGNENLQISFEVMAKSAEAIQPSTHTLKSPSELDIDLTGTISDPRQVIDKEVSSLTVIKKKSLSDSSANKKKQKPIRVEVKRAPKVKTSRVSSPTRKGKSSNSNSSNLNKPESMVSKSQGPLHKPKKIIKDSANGHFEVEEKLNELLDIEGGISKKQNAAQGYLKLLFLTAASGDSVSGEVIQSNRDLSMILGAIWKTKSRSVLVDVISKNGLQMLHNILKRCRRDFNRIPILRKLLKVLEFLATKEILTVELINRDPSCAGVESFRESILSLAEHDDKQVHQIARNFRDRWIPRSLRRNTDYHRVFNGNRHSSHNHWRERSPQTRDAVDGNKQSVVATVPVSVDAISVEGCSSPCNTVCPTSATVSRKRKSRWDQPAESNKEQKFSVTRADEDGANMDEDGPPGFAPSRGVSSLNQGSSYPAKVELGHPQVKFMNCLAVSYGVPMPIVQQLGYSKTDSLEDWFIAPGVPFQPYPPLPTYSRNRWDDMKEYMGNHQPAMSQPDHNHPSSTPGMMNSHVQIQVTNNCHSFHEASKLNGLGRYYRQQKCNNSGLPPPWKRKRNGWGFRGNDSRNRCGSRNASEDRNNMENDLNSFPQNLHQQGYH